MIKLRGLCMQFSGFIGMTCITEVESFQIVCLCKPVLTTALSALNNLRGDKIDFENR